VISKLRIIGNVLTINRELYLVYRSFAQTPCFQHFTFRNEIKRCLTPQ